MSLKSVSLKWVVAIFSLSLIVSCGGGGGSTPTGDDGGNAGDGGGNTASIVSEGTSSVPKDLGIAPLTYTGGTVAYGGNSYYQFRTGQAGSYVISVASTNVNMVWDLYSQKSDFDNWLVSGIAYGNDLWTSITDLIDTAPNLDANTTYYIEVENGNTNGNGGTYTISVSSGSSEGSKNTPTALTADGYSHAGGIDTYGYSYYSFTSAGGSYVISLGGLSVPADILSWRVYSDAAFTTLVSGETCNDYYSSGSPGEISCAAPNLPAGTYYVQVYNYGSQDTSYSITVAPDSSGSYIQAPMQLALETTYNQTISDNGYDYYYFVVPMGGSGTYKINLSSTNADMEWELYSGSTYSTSLMQCNTTSSAGAESCMSGNIDHGTYYVKVYTKDTPPGPGTYPYSITVTTQGCSEGSPNEPVLLTPETPHTGGRLAPSNLIYSYYTFTTESLPSPAAYLVKITSQNPATQWPDWSLFSDKALTTQVAWCGRGPIGGDTFCVTYPPQSAAPAMLTPNSQYYLVVGNDFATQPMTYTLNVVPFDPSTGCTAGGDQCFTFETGSTDPLTLSSTGSSGTGLWSRSTTTSGAGSQSLTSGIGQKNENLSCVQFTATDVKWISFSFKAPFVDAQEFLRFNISNSQVLQTWYNGQPWQRMLFPGQAGSHVYEWCYEKTYYTSGYDNVFLDDIELNY